MATRLELHQTLVNILGSKYCYYQPPETIKMRYPAIVYNLDSIEARYADNGRYMGLNRYTVTVIDKDPDSELPRRMITLPYCRFSRHFTSDNLHHFVFTLYA